MNRIIYTLFILFTGITTISAQDYDKWVKEQWDKEFNGPSNRPLYRHEIGVTIGGAVAFNNKRYLSFTDNAKSKYNLFIGKIGDLEEVLIDYYNALLDAEMAYRDADEALGKQILDNLNQK